MCTCVSCKATDKLDGWTVAGHGVNARRVPDLESGGFAAWPKGEGRRAKDTDYAAHWAHCGAAFHRKAAAFKPGAPATYQSWVTCQLNMPIPQAPAWVRDWINRGAVRVRHPAADAVPFDNVSVGHPVKIRAPRAIAAPADGPSIRELLERAIAIRGERAQEKIAA